MRLQLYGKGSVVLIREGSDGKVEREGKGRMLIRVRNGRSSIKV